MAFFAREIRCALAIRILPILVRAGCKQDVTISCSYCCRPRRPTVSTKPLRFLHYKPSSNSRRSNVRSCWVPRLPEAIPAPTSPCLAIHSRLRATHSRHFISIAMFVLATATLFPIRSWWIGSLPSTNPRVCFRTGAGRTALRISGHST